MTPRLLCATPLPPAIAERASVQFNAVLSQDSQPDAAAVIAMLDAEPTLAAVLISSRVRLDAAGVAALPAQVKLIACCSVGYEQVDVAAAAARGIHVSNTPDVVSAATADMALFLLLGACRRGREYAAIMERGWRERFGLAAMLGMDVGGKTLGIVGMGRIGQEVAQRARAFGIQIVYHNRRRLAPAEEQGARYFDSLVAMLPHCQLLSLHMPGTRASDGVIGAAELALLPRGAVLVNTARGLLVDEEALLAALASGQLGAAGLDVFRAEPDYDLRLRAQPNVFMTPHMGTATVETRDAMGHRALDNVAAVFAGQAPPDALRAG
jgi:lactate dehydrogenase-like 2-hydroxyacid dehydrogenase